MSLLRLRLKPPQSQQLTQIVDLDKSCLGGLWSLEGYQRELDSPNSSFLAVSMATSENENIIGCGCFWEILEEAHITLLMVHPDYQGRGLGQLLLYSLLKDALRRQLERATLEVRASNEVALSLYQQFGFKIAGRRKGYYQSTGEDALVLWRGDLAKSEFKDFMQFWQEKIDNKLIQSGFTLLDL